jgi:hypothetical protein
MVALSLPANSVRMNTFPPPHSRRSMNAGYVNLSLFHTDERGTIRQLDSPGESGGDFSPEHSIPESPHVLQPISARLSFASSLGRKTARYSKTSDWEMTGPDMYPRDSDPVFVDWSPGVPRRQDSNVGSRYRERNLASPTSSLVSKSSTLPARLHFEDHSLTVPHDHSANEAIAAFLRRQSRKHKADRQPESPLTLQKHASYLALVGANDHLVASRDDIDSPHMVARVVGHSVHMIPTSHPLAHSSSPIPPADLFDTEPAANIFEIPIEQTIEQTIDEPAEVPDEAYLPDHRHAMSSGLREHTASQHPDPAPPTIHIVASPHTQEFEC